ncbi:hypothetical protein Mkiyose1665_30160 [Mycobacterium kiyosense]|uniref:Uncharacterized protein n=1 Tax=Mycobacterium kiyosense TaxID=2871094 RepID=A0A9P3Q345_9MYCO|nr:hypothetical protein IWGMT90018_14880 [Mycobacterium kiyosense]BDE12838.1 hypothetical protein MKCMC460_16980 [Mycobacterium sp. 20KCMC460]GLB82512.1 hypothetical protein SRL2020028_17680 [Mycobacterium kiyosense]GLB90283.1 hypothetical protein SRL2020130_31000 [Mycobacterium kiyosense]GLB93886.1 hypothetical protein SRL2020226_06620 [Mycobacterium kiyosense]
MYTRPPIRLRASITRTGRPASARLRAAARPAMPAPTIKIDPVSGGAVLVFSLCGRGLAHPASRADAVRKPRRDRDTGVRVSHAVTGSCSENVTERTLRSGKIVRIWRAATVPRPSGERQ